MYFCTENIMSMSMIRLVDLQLVIFFIKFHATFSQCFVIMENCEENHMLGDEDSMVMRREYSLQIMYDYITITAI